ncbi:acyl carrier protein [Priestia aryabhattai]|uniref:acyl carrier protein n=1 Tax=Priestia aryabhattai TaxID=412384 RepID=UPI0024536B16|nr:acyl carrier protein [Priestia aryabhattai]MDH3133893.1 acyl carrier protein [Priestia aryabhattai]
MENDKIFMMIRESILVFSPLKETNIKIDSNLSGDLALDSTDRLELVLDLEQKLDIRFQLRIMAGVKRLRTLCC